MYITYWLPQKTRQISFDEIMAGITNVNQLQNVSDKTATVTVCRNNLTERLFRITNTPAMIAQLYEFNAKYDKLEHCDLKTHYRHFEIPKKSGGWRPIDAPDKELSDALVELRELLKGFMIASYHTAAHAYIPGRGILTAVRKHQAGHIKKKFNPELGYSETIVYENNFTASFDFHGFFPSTSPEFLFRMLSQIYPFALIMQNENGNEQLRQALSLVFLNGGLPQGTPISPWLTNVMMIPFDHIISRKLARGYTMKDGIEREFTYTRYADDIDISCPLSFDPLEIQQIIINALRFVGAPFTLNEKKTHYGNRHSSKNWMLGLMWNSNNEITVGWRNMKYFKAALTNYVEAKKRGRNWDIEDVQKLNGKISYYRMVERNMVNYIIETYNNKFEVDIEGMIKADLRPTDGYAA